MFFIYLVLGCWLPFVVPEHAETLTLWWQVAIWLSAFLHLFVAVGLTMRWLKIDQVKVVGELQIRHVNIYLLGLSALLSGHPFMAVLFVTSAYGLALVGKVYKKLAK